MPPEIKSARMYAGPGPGSILAAAAAWQSLAEELSYAAANYGSIVWTRDQRTVDGSQFDVDGRRRTVCDLARCYRRAGAADRRASHIGGKRVRNRLHRNSSAAAMYSYADATATASQVTPFTTPPQTTNPDGLAGHAAAGLGQPRVLGYRFVVFVVLDIGPIDAE